MARRTQNYDQPPFDNDPRLPDIDDTVRPLDMYESFDEHGRRYFAIEGDPQDVRYDPNHPLTEVEIVKRQQALLAAQRRNAHAPQTQYRQPQFQPDSGTPRTELDSRLEPEQPERKSGHGKLWLTLAAASLVLTGGFVAYEYNQPVDTARPASDLTTKTSSTPNPRAGSSAKTQTPPLTQAANPTPSPAASPSRLPTSAGTKTVRVPVPAPPAPSKVGEIKNQTERTGHTVPRNFMWANVEGFWHTGPSGEKPGGMDGRKRMNIMAGFVLSHHIDVAAFSEFEKPQKAQFLKVTDDKYGVVYADGHAHNAVVYRKAAFEQMPGDATYTNVYFNGRHLKQPIARLKDRVSGVITNFLSIHNPAPRALNYYNQGKYDTQAIAKEKQVISHLVGRTILAGDFNEHRRPAAVFMKKLGMISPLGNTYATLSHKPPIDQLYASRSIKLSNYQNHTSPDIKKSTDHRVVYTATIQ